MDNRLAEKLVLSAASVYNTAPGGLVGLFEWKESFRNNGCYGQVCLIYEYVRKRNFNPNESIFVMDEREKKDLVKMLVDGF